MKRVVFFFCSSPVWSYLPAGRRREKKRLVSYRLNRMASMAI